MGVRSSCSFLSSLRLPAGIGEPRTEYWGVPKKRENLLFFVSFYCRDLRPFDGGNDTKTQVTTNPQNLSIRADENGGPHQKRDGLHISNGVFLN